MEFVRIPVGEFLMGADADHAKPTKSRSNSLPGRLSDGQISDDGGAVCRPLSKPLNIAWSAIWMSRPESQSSGHGGELEGCRRLLHVGDPTDRPAGAFADRGGGRRPRAAPMVACIRGATPNRPRVCATSIGTSKTQRRWVSMVRKAIVPTAVSTWRAMHGNGVRIGMIKTIMPNRPPKIRPARLMVNSACCEAGLRLCSDLRPRLESRRVQPRLPVRQLRFSVCPWHILVEG